ncbi:sigma-70 family RNA polymerase sigma factor [Labrys sp. KNU-23]|uniref:RNA polymerase sigma factor n=1 Tax=Labrys sp. KNU-23 TaxID=2789216 RepID=UPI0011F024B6|nr:sigma-70 family RNA polymerase sigma factor [Labrys sp. KNU-23]QEN85799.1 sigma-70 family RNA polymerase sigma factor [Labrys sp. KNU-23]
MVLDIRVLFVRHAKEVSNTLRRKGVTAENAADLTQETFLRLLSAEAHAEVDHANPRALLHRIARNLRIDQQRRERLVLKDELADEAFVAISDDRPSPETIVSDRQRLAIVTVALAELPDRTRQAFQMHRLGEKTISEIARELGLSTTRTWTLIREAYLHVRARLHEKV